MNATRKATDELFKNALNLPTPEAGPSLPFGITWKLNQGDAHRLYVQVTPQDLDDSGHWALAVKTKLVHPLKGTAEQLESLTMNDRGYPGPLHQPLKPVLAAGFRVQIVNGDPTGA
jgi:hypothetical protein